MKIEGSKVTMSMWEYLTMGGAFIAMAICMLIMLCAFLEIIDEAERIDKNYLLIKKPAFLKK